MITQIWQGHKGTYILAKDRNEYGSKILNSVGVFRRSAISALLFIIYLGDVMHDYKALHDNKGVHKKYHKKDAQQNK